MAVGVLPTGVWDVNTLEWDRFVQPDASGPGSGLTDAELRASAVAVSAATLPLPTGAATAALQLPNSHDVTIDNAAGAAAVNIQDGGNVITVDGTVEIAAGTNNIGDIDVLSTVPPANRNQEEIFTTNGLVENGTPLITEGAEIVGWEIARASGAGTQSFKFQASYDATNYFDVNVIQLDGTISATVSVSGTTLRGIIPVAGYRRIRARENGDSGGGSTFAVRTSVTTGGRPITLPGQQTMANSQSVALASDQTALSVSQSSTPWSVKEQRAATPAQSSVADSASNVTLLASNAARLGASIANDSSAALYVKLGATATTTSYTARLLQYGYYEVPFGYTGIIDGIWATDPGDGAARVTELT